MVAFDGSESCQEAEVYYHDYLEDPRNPSMAEYVAIHIEGCAYCQNRIQMLREALSGMDTRPQAALPEKDSQLIAELQSHFEHLDEPLTCGHVKPFLCRLVSPSMRIRIPTPITVHVDQCDRCAEDLESLRQLELGADPLDRLGQLLGKDPTKDPRLCVRAHSQIAAFASLAFKGIAAEIIEHICVCPRCRNQVYQHRQGLLDRARRAAIKAQPASCGHIKTSELMDCAIPCGRGPESFRTDRQQVLSVHIRSCPRCLEKMQEMHRTVSRIMERADSGVTTVYTTQDQAEMAAESSRPDSYGVYPIEVEVSHEHATTRADLGLRARLKHRISDSSIRSFGRIAFLAAAMIPLAILFVVSMPAASGLSIRQMDRVLGKAGSISVSVFHEGDSEPTQRLWICRDSGILISELALEQRIYDLRNRRATVVRPNPGTVERFHLSDRDYEAAERSMRRYLESSLDGAPLDAQLTHQPAASGLEQDGFEVYELTWDRPLGMGAPVPSKLKIYVDPATKLPQRQEFSSWVPVTNDWRVQTTRYEYPNEDAIEARRQALLSVR